MTNLSKNEILAASNGWIASFLNFFPGLGSGYIYQRRWIPYFLTLGATTFWVAIGIILKDDKEPTQNQQLIGISGLLFISIITIIEANLSYKKVLKEVSTKTEVSKTFSKKGWFKK